MSEPVPPADDHRFEQPDAHPHGHPDEHRSLHPVDHPGEPASLDLYRHAPCGLLVTEPDGSITSVNATLLDWTGYAERDLVGCRSFASLLSAGGRIYHETHFAPSLRMHGHAREIALDIVAADGRRLPVLVNATLDRDGAGEPVRIRIAVFGASDRREYERELLGAKVRAEASEAHTRLLAQTLQRMLIPHAVPAIPGLEIAAVYRPAGDGDEIGGDFYDVFQVGIDDWVIALGDVEGKGVDAAVVTGVARYTIRAAAVEHERPSDVLRLLNGILRADDIDRYCTAVVLRCRRRDGRWHVALSCGGHPLPLLAAADGGLREIGVAGTLLGFFDHVDLHDAELTLTEGDTVVVHTDGLTEGRHAGHLFGEDSVRRTVDTTRDRPVGEIAQTLLDEVLTFQLGQPRDDVAALVFRPAAIIPTDS